jgi:hypothetical protein
MWHSMDPTFYGIVKLLLLQNVQLQGWMNADVVN